MGAGELAAFYVWWSIDRAPSKSIILLEEPETFLSAGAQESLYNVILSHVVEKSLFCVITSHSPALIVPAGRDGLMFFFREGASIRQIVDQPAPILLASVGIYPQLKAIVFVEDRAAESFARTILERYDSSFSRSVELRIRNGEGDIRTALQAIGKNVDGSVRFVGLFDGDQEGKIEEPLLAQSALLPGSKPVEILLREMVEADPESLAEIVGSSKIVEILIGLHGLDYHDWYERLCGELSYRTDQLYRQLFVLWLRRAENGEAANRTYHRLYKIVTGEDLAIDVTPAATPAAPQNTPATDPPSPPPVPPDTYPP